MKKLSLFLSILLLAMLSISVEAAKITAEYNEIEFSALKIAPEKYDKKKVIYSEKYQRYSTTFPGYMEKSGLSSKKHLLLSIGDIKIPAVCDKTDSMVKFIGGLERGSTVKVYGKVRKLRVDSKFRSMAPEYYVDVDKIELTAKPKEDKMQKADDKEDRRTVKRKLPPRKLRR